MSKTIVLAMLNESGHLNPTYKLSRALRARGHDVRYLAFEELRPQIEAQGFAVEPLYPELFPAGYAAADEQLGTVARRRLVTRRYRALIDALGARPPFALGDGRPNLLLIDITQTQIALWARSANVPFAYLNTSLPQTEDAGVPPLRSGLGYGATRAGRVQAELAWRRFVVQRRAGARAAALLGALPPYAIARAAAARFGVAEDALDERTVYMPQLRGVPELVLCAQVFDFPRAPSEWRFHVESIDLQRREADFEWNAIPNGKTLVYCSLGGQRYRPAETPGFFSRVIAAVATRPDCHLLLSVGRHVAPTGLGRLPDNVTVVTVAPQLAVLRRAAVMVTHGGLGSVKECIVHGVPMLVCPLDVDQPGNAARVLHHGLGLRVDVRASSVDEIGHALDRLLGDASFRERCAAMRAEFEALEASAPGADVVERFAI